VERLSALDAAILDAETPAQPLSVLGVLVLEPNGDADGQGYRRVHDRIAERYALLPQMRRRLQRLPLGRPVWVDARVHVGQHLHHGALDAPGDDRQLGIVTGEVAAQPLARQRPLWEAWFIEGLSGGHNAVIASLHHCAIDGVAGIGALAAFFDLERDPVKVEAPSWQPEPEPSVEELGRAALTGAGAWSTEAGRGVAHLVGAARDAVRRAQRDARGPLPFSGPRLSMNGALTSRRVAAFARVSLADVKRVCRPFGLTVNDVVLAVTTGLLRRYLDDRGELPERPLVAAVPTSERALGDESTANSFSAMFCGLPVELADPTERLLAVQRSAATAKKLHQQAGGGLFAILAGMAPPGLVWPLMRAASLTRVADQVPPLANLFVSNVRGPDFPLYVAGSQLEHLYPLGPLLEGVGLNLTVASYRDEVAFGFLACPDLVPDVADLAEAVPAALAELVAVAGAATKKRSAIRV